MKSVSNSPGGSGSRFGSTYLPGYSADVFISYSHIDDLPFGEDGIRWVTEFHRNLDIRVRAYLGRAATFWRDPKLGGSDVFSDEIAGQLRGTGVLVSVLSPGYLQSEWCHRELQTFVEAAQETGGIDVGRKKRLVKVVKTPVTRNEIPQILDSVLGHEFFSNEWGTDSSREFHLDPSPEARRLYWARLDDVAQEIRALFESLIKRELDMAPNRAAAATIYLAATSSDLQNERDRLRRELQDRGNLVLPDAALPYSAERFIESVRADLQRSQLSVHLLGSRYGIVPEGEHRSIVELQNDLAAEQKTPGFRRMIWLPPGLNIADERQKKFVEALRLRSNPEDRFELLETSLEDLKTFVLDRLRESNSAPKTVSTPGAPTRVYLICEQRDRADVAPLRKHLLDSGHEVTLPIAKGEPHQVRQDHRENLLLCDSVLIYWGHGDEFWLRSKVRDLARARGIGRTDPFTASAVLIADPASPEKDEFVSREALVIRQASPDIAACVGPFVEALSGFSRA
jgi:hypothetical protein